MIKTQRRAKYLALKAELAREAPDPQRVLTYLRAFAELENLQSVTRAWNASVASRFVDPELARSIALAGLRENPSRT